MLNIKPIKKVTVTEQIMEHIAELIISGQIKAGEKLPNERDLAKQFGVTRSRIREALRALSLVGLIMIKAGEGSFVNKQEVPIPAETIIWMFHNEKNNLDEVYAARKLIESEIYILAASKPTQENINKLKKTINLLPDALGDLERFQDLLDELDLYMGKICGNKIYAKLMQTIVHLRRETILKLHNVPGAMENSIRIRSQIVEAIEEGDLDKTKQAVEFMFQSSKEFYTNIQ